MGDRPLTSKKVSYRPPAGDMAGVQTYVNQTNKQNLPPNTDKSPSDNYSKREKGQNAPENKQQALPITPKHKPQRQQTPPVSETGGGGGSASRPQINVPPHSDGAPGGKSLHKDRVRTKGVPGEEYGHPHTQQDYRIKKRRPGVLASDEEAGIEAGYMDGRPPAQRQRNQRGQSKRYMKIKDRQPKKKKPRQRERKKWWKRVRNRGTVKKYKRFQRKMPKRFKRIPGGGFPTPASRTKNWREKGNPGAYEEYEKKRQEKRKKERARDKGTKLQTKSATDIQNLPILSFYEYEEVAVVLEVSIETETVAVDIGGETYDLSFEFLAQQIEHEEDFDALFDYIEEVGDLAQEFEMEEFDKEAAFYRDQKRPDRLPQSWTKDRSKGTPDGEDSNAQSYDGGPTWVVPMSSRPGLTEERENQTPAQKLQQPAVTNNPGSAKVIPSGYGFVNKVASQYLSRQAARIAEIWDGTDSKIHQRSTGLPVKLKKTVPKHAYWLFEVQGKTGNYLVRLQAQRRGNVRDINKLNVRLSCTCDFWRWQGPEHWAKSSGYLYGKPRGSAEAPDQKDPDGKHRMCKHVAAVLMKAKSAPYRVRPRSSFNKKGHNEDALRYLSDSITMGRVSVSYQGFDDMVARIVTRYGQEKS